MKQEYERDTKEYYCHSRAEFRILLRLINVLPMFQIYIYAKSTIYISIDIGWLFIHGNYTFKYISKKEVEV